MLNIDEIKNTISELENEPTTFVTCTKLASLYTVLDHILPKNDKNFVEMGENNEENDEIIKEYDDILPSYMMYKTVKTKYQLHQLTSDAVIDSMQNLCKEIEELLKIIYSSSDMQEERLILKEMLKNCSNFSEFY